jgi:hypothetical protein
VIAASDDYIPLADLRAGPFYDFQHEISYLEAASFVKFLVEQHGLDRLKELYALATGDATQDETLVQRLYGRSYDQLEAEWLDYLDGLSPTPEQARAWQLEVRSFDLMRQYETKLDPDARLLPSKPPTEWMTDTLEAFLHRTTDPVNVALETALIAGQVRLHRGDLDDATALLDDVEAALETDGEPNRPSLQARMAILELLAEQDRAILLADKSGYLDTISPAYVSNTPITDTLQLPFTTSAQEVVKLDVADDGLSAEGVILVHAQVANGSFAEDGRLFAVDFAQTPLPVPAQRAGTGKQYPADGWLMSSRQPAEPLPFSLPARGD